MAVASLVAPASCGRAPDQAENLLLDVLIEGRPGTDDFGQEGAIGRELLRLLLRVRRKVLFFPGFSGLFDPSPGC